MTSLSVVLGKLSERFYRENDISDITYTLFNADSDFKKTFLEVVFPGSCFDKILSIQREFPENNSRPDFIIETESQKYFIEVKKWDKNHHFEQYEVDFPNYKRAYITNYKIDAVEKEKYKSAYIFHTWKELSGKLSEKNESIRDKTIEGYLKYLKAVCCFMEVKDMRFGNLSNLAQFNMFVKEMLDNTYDSGQLRVHPYDTKYNFSITHSGSYFSLSKEGSDRCIYPWFGVIYTESTVEICICMEFDRGWCSVLESHRVQIQEKLNSRQNVKCQLEPNEIRAQIDENIFRKFQGESNVHNQKEILTSFFKDVILSLKDFI